MNTDDLDTPIAVVDLDRLESNITRFQRYFDEHHIPHRPHIKTHKLPTIAHLQMRAGAVGITCQKIGEAEVMADAGLDDIFRPYNILGHAKLERLMRLARRVKLSVTADLAFTVKGYSEAARQASIPLPVLVECDTGGKRCGVQSPQEAAELAQIIAQSPGLRWGGLMTHPCNSQSDNFIRETKSLLKADGFAVERVSVIPNHVCVVTNLFNQIVGVRRDAVETIWPVAARGALT